MATYVSLIQFTDQGIRNVKDTVKRGEATMAEDWRRHYRSWGNTGKLFRIDPLFAVPSISAKRSVANDAHIVLNSRKPAGHTR